MSPIKKHPLSLNTDNSYLLGLIVGGGEIIGQRLTITLPYRNWGDLKINPRRGGEITSYIVRVVKPMWENEYDMHITYSVLNGSWEISGTVTDKLLSDISELGLPKAGNFREKSDLSILSDSLNNNEKIKRFIAGLTDTVGSLARSHRHRVDSFQIISYEFTGKNFALVSQLARLFGIIDCYPNQILWNHPNFHSGTDRYYSSWKKGFKLRIALTDYMLVGSFVSEAKKLSASENLALRKAASSFNQTGTVRINSRTTLHKDEKSDWLPEAIRGKHFVHFEHLSHFLGIQVNQDSLEYLRQKLKKPESLVCPFTILTKGTTSEIDSIIENEPYLKQTEYKTLDLPGDFFSRKLADPENKFIFGISKSKGFPLTHVIHAVTYVALAESGSKYLKGKRILGDRISRFEEIESIISSIGIEIMRPDRGTCLLVKGRGFAALVGYTDDDFNAKLIRFDKDNMMFEIKEPIYSDCVSLG